jgi:hypothetical protein
VVAVADRSERRTVSRFRAPRAPVAPPLGILSTPARDSRPAGVALTPSWSVQLEASISAASLSDREALVRAVEAPYEGPFSRER